MKLGQNVFLNEISDVFENGLCGVKNSLGQMLEIPCLCSRVHIFSQIFMKLCKKFCVDKISDILKSGSCRVKN